jgi:hypothetical protein
MTQGVDPEFKPSTAKKKKKKIHLEARLNSGTKALSSNLNIASPFPPKKSALSRLLQI